MKKIMMIITGIAAVFLFFTQYRMANYNESYVSYNYPDYIAEIIDLKQCPMEFQFQNEEDGKAVIRTIQQFVEDNQYTYLVEQSETLSDSQQIFRQIIFSPHQNVLSRLYVEKKDEIDFSNVNDSCYYSTEFNDENSSGYIRVMDKNWFDMFGKTYRFETAYHLEECLQKDLSLYYYFFTDNHKEFYQELVSYFNEHIPDIRLTITDYTEGYAPSHITALDDVLLKSSQDVLILLVVLFLVSVFIHIFHKSKEIVIRKMMGTSVLKILIKSYVPIFLLCWLIYFVVQAIMVYLYMDEYNLLFENFICSLLSVYKILSVGLLAVIILIYIYITLMTHVLFLKKTSFKEIVYIQNIVKICMIILMIVPLVQSYNNAYPAVNRYLELIKHEDELRYSVHIMTDANDEIFDYLNKNGQFVDFSEHMSIYKDYVYDNWDDLDKDAIDGFALSYPKITANVNYLKDYHIKDENNQEIDFHLYQDDILLVPLAYKNSDELDKYKHGTKEIVFIQNNGRFFDLSLDNPIIYVKNPIIHVTIKNSFYFDTHYVYCSTKEKSIQEYYDDMKNLTSQSFEIYNRDQSVSISFIIDKNDMIRFSFVFLMYCLVMILFVYLTLYVFIYENQKKLCIQYILGHHLKQRYQQLLIINSISYLIPLIISIIMNTTVKNKDIFQFLFLFFVFEIIIEIIYLHYYLKHKGVSLLKGETL